MRYIYYVAYEDSEGYGSAEMGIDEKISYFEQIQRLQDKIADRYKIKNVSVRNFILLRTEND